MLLPFWAATLNILAAICTMGLAVYAWYGWRISALYRQTAVILLSTSLVSLASGILISHAAYDALWLRIMMGGQLLQMLAVASVGTSFRPQLVQGRRAAVIAASTGVAGLLGLLMGSRLIVDTPAFEAEASHLFLGRLGRVFLMVLLIGMVLGLARIEALLRGLTDPLRYQAKYVLIGMGTMAAYQVYFNAQLLLLPVWESDLFLTGALIVLMGCGLIAVGLKRSRREEIQERFYVSLKALVGSFTVVAVGLYLLAVGSVAGWLQGTGREWGAVTSLLAVFGGVVGLIVLVASRSVRLSAKELIARHFVGAKYDYRAKWLEVTEAFRGGASIDAMFDCLRDLLARTFSASKISVWFRYDADGHFHQVRSLNTEPRPNPIAPDDGLVRRMEERDEPVLLEAAASSDRPKIYVPILSRQRLKAFIMLSREGEAHAFGVDDCDLLRMIANHVGLLLSNAEMAEERLMSAELEALHRFSAFCLHDLKNLAGKLSLLAQNAEVHGASPAFQQSAMKTVASTVRQMTGLIEKLSVKPLEDPKVEQVDVNGILREIAEQLRGGAHIGLEVNLEEIPPVTGSRDQIHQVFWNVILNARQCGGPHPLISIASTYLPGFVTVTVADRGPGIPPDRLRTLFHPFQTTKREGMGVGLYQCKQIIEAHKGTITVQSRIGVGTTVRIQLPAAQSLVRGAGRAQVPQPATAP
jgi:putative PEP-CTERM system histidine kinase